MAVISYLVGEVDGDVRQRYTSGEWPALTTRGARHALRVMEALKSEDILRIVSGPSVRCLQTLMPLVVSRRLKVEVDPVLGEIASVHRVLDVIAETATQPTVFCMPTSLLQAVADLVLLVGVPIDGFKRYSQIKTVDSTLLCATEQMTRSIRLDHRAKP